MKKDIPTLTRWKQRIKSRTRKIYRNIEAARLRRVRRHRKAKYTHCKNCGMELKGMYCHRCGQYALDIYQPFWKYIQQYFENVYQFDTKIWQTLRLLFTRPGFLTREFNAGKISSYVHPFRLYMCISVVFFTIFFIVIENHTTQIVSASLTPTVTDKLVQELNSGKLHPDTTIYAYNGKEFAQSLANKGVERTDSLINAVNMYTSQGLYLMRLPHVLLDSCFRQVEMDTTELADIRKMQQTFDLTKLNKLLPAEFNIQFGSGTEIQQIQDAYQGFSIDSIQGVHTPVYQWTPQTDTSRLLSIDSTVSFIFGQLSKWTPFYMMFLLPLFALLLKRTHRKLQMPYMWHFVHAIHLNTVFLLLFSIPLGITFTCLAWQYNTIKTDCLPLFGVFFLLMFIYMYISMHTVYRYGWIRTFLKTLYVFLTFSLTASLIASGLIIWLALEVADKV